MEKKIATDKTDARVVIIIKRTMTRMSRLKLCLQSAPQFIARSDTSSAPCVDIYRRLGVLFYIAGLHGHTPFEQHRIITDLILIESVIGSVLKVKPNCFSSLIQMCWLIVSKEMFVTVNNPEPYCP